MGTVILANLLWEKMVFGQLGMGISDRKTIELGLRFYKIRKTIGLKNRI